MQWLIPAISIDCGFKFAVAFILFVRFFETQKKTIFWWAMGWLFFGLHGATELTIIGTKYEFLWFIRHIFYAFPAVAFLESVGNMQQPRLKIWHIAAAIVGLGAIISSYIGVFVIREWYAATIPASFLSGLGFIVCAFYFLKITKGGGSAARLPIFLGFFLNGVHNLDYPFLRPITWFAPIGFSLGVVFAIIFAVGLIMMSTEELKRQREKSQYTIRDLSILTAISSIVSHSFNIEEILTDVLDEILKAIKIERGCIFLLDEKAKELNLKTYRGLSPEYTHKMVKLNLDQEKTICTKVARTGEPAIAANISEHPEFKTPEVQKERLQSVACIPLKSKEKIMGILSISSHKYHRFAPHELQLLTSIGSIVGVAVENSKLYENLKTWNKELEKIIAEHTKDLTNARKATLNMLEDINETYKELKETQAQLVRKERLAAIGQMAAIVGHEVRNPLTSIKMSAYYLNKKLTKTTPQVTKIIQDIEKEIERAAGIITNILEYSRPPKLTLNPTDINILLEETLRFAKEKIQFKNIEIIKKFDSSIPKVPLDSFRFKQVLDNIILNASQAMPEGGKLTVQTQVVDNKLGIRVTDSGIGITKEKFEKIFEPFFTNRRGGLGLGLAVVSEIIRMHQGSIKVESKIKEGCTFIIKLPLRGG